MPTESNIIAESNCSDQTCVIEKAVTVEETDNDPIVPYHLIRAYKCHGIKPLRRVGYFLIRTLARFIPKSLNVIVCMRQLTNMPKRVLLYLASFVKIRASVAETLMTLTSNHVFLTNVGELNCFLLGSYQVGLRKVCGSLLVYAVSETLYGGLSGLSGLSGSFTANNSWKGAI